MTANVVDPAGRQVGARLAAPGGGTPRGPTTPPVPGRYHASP